MKKLIERIEPKYLAKLEEARKETPYLAEEVESALKKHDNFLELTYKDVLNMCTILDIDVRFFPIIFD